MKSKQTHGACYLIFAHIRYISVVDLFKQLIFIFTDRNKKNVNKSSRNLQLYISNLILDQTVNIV